MKVYDEDRICVMEGEWNVESVIRDICHAGAQEDPFYVMDLGVVLERFRQWREYLPRVEPFYAVKCNDDRVLLRALAALGTGFDCASRNEIQLVTDLGVPPERIIFANPAKMSSHIRHAAEVGVRMMTFDSETELYKISQNYSNAELVVRIRCDALVAQCPLGIKFGCEPFKEAPRLIKLAALMKLDVVGVSFHVGSGARDCGAWGMGVQIARRLFELGDSLGMRMRLLDVGGGYRGRADDSLHEVSQVINESLDKHFAGREVRVIAEPGRYFAAAAYTLAAQVHGIRQLKMNLDPEIHTMYFINDGVYGSFNCVLYDHQAIEVEPLDDKDAAPTPCSVWGPSCDALDCVLTGARLAAQASGAWLLFRNMGAYTLPVASPFNGFPVPRVRHVADAAVWEELKELWPLSASDFTHDPPTAPQPAPAPRAAAPRRPVYVDCGLK